MHSLSKAALSLICALAISGCATDGQPKVSPPKLQPVPASLMQPPTTEQRVRAELFEPQGTPTIKSVGSKPY